MSDASLSPRPTRIRPLDVVISCTVLFVLAVAQPLLDLLGRNAEFFLARAAPAIDIVALALLLAVAIPILLGLIVVGVRRIHRPTGRVLHGVVLTVLTAVLALQIVERTPLRSLPGWLEMAIALAAGVLLTIAYFRSDTLRSVGRFGAVVPLIVIGLFLFTSAASQLVFATPAIAQPAQVAVGNPSPVVMIVFDEFPAASLMDGEGNLEEAVYPNFARLARDGAWFNNAITVQQQTEYALPAILTGNDPPTNKLPTASDHPASLFTLLAESHDLKVQEAVTGMCPEYACANTNRPTRSVGRRWSTLIDDLRIVAGHLFLPDDMTADLPPIDASWSNFSGSGDRRSRNLEMIERFNEIEDRRAPVEQWLDGIVPVEGEPPLHFLHALIPHVPWAYLPSGQDYNNPGRAPGTISPGWGPDVWLVDQAQQQHLVMVQYADTVIGRMIERLEEAGIYDESLIVVLSDHGITIRPDIPHRRVAYEDTIGDIAGVPLFIKPPHSLVSGVDDYRAETVDVLPTMADVLEIDLPWSTDGSSLFAEQRPARTQSQITGDEGTLVFGTDGAEARAVAARKIEHFGTDGPFGLAPPGQADLLGLAVADLDLKAPDGVAATMRDRDDYDAIDVDGPSLPAWLTGILRTDDAAEDVLIAVGVNGEIVAVTRGHETDEGRKEFGAMIPPEVFVDGANEVTLVLVRGSGTERTFHEITA